jgi:GH43 family beta-xylosidase
VALAAATLPALAQGGAGTRTFRNPVLAPGQDPSILRWGGNYYLVQSRGGIQIYTSPTLTGLGRAKPVRVWWDFKDGSDLNAIWAPELVALDGKFYLYFSAAKHGELATHRSYVLEASDPLGPWTFKGQITDPSDLWSIDGTVLEQGGKRYFVWSGWEGPTNGREQRLYIARMRNPWTIEGPRHELSRPDRPWERTGPAAINEGPEVLRHGKALHLIYSASHSFTDDYCLGRLTYRGGEITDRRSWVKADGCVFAKNVAAGVFGPGHDTLVKSPDGREDWNVYHANAVSGCGWKCRTIRMQPIRWRRDDTPDFGVPLSLGTDIPAPSGE